MKNVEKDKTWVVLTSTDLVFILQWRRETTFLDYLIIFNIMENGFIKILDEICDDVNLEKENEQSWTRINKILLKEKLNFMSPYIRVFRDNLLRALKYTPKAEIIKTIILKKLQPQFGQFTTLVYLKLKRKKKENKDSRSKSVE